MSTASTSSATSATAEVPEAAAATTTQALQAAAGKPGHVVCRVGDIPEGGRKIVQIGNKSIGIFHLKGGRFHALLNVCPHQLAPLCAGRVTGTMSFTDKVGEFKWEREGEIVRCPWHAWEFDITTGRSIFNPHKVRTRAYPVSVVQPDIAGEAKPGTPAEGTSVPSDHSDPETCSNTARGIEAESVESFPVSVEDNVIIVHL